MASSAATYQQRVEQRCKLHALRLAGILTRISILGFEASSQYTPNRLCWSSLSHAAAAPHSGSSVVGRGFRNI